MNDGKMNCGAYYTIELNQQYELLHVLVYLTWFRTALTIVVSAEGKGVGIAPFRDPASYCIYIDIQYQDGDNLYGQVISFSEGTHVIQYK
jgi:hypothetical protein